MPAAFLNLSFIQPLLYFENKESYQSLIMQA